MWVEWMESVVIWVPLLKVRLGPYGEWEKCSWEQIYSFAQPRASIKSQQ